MAGCQRREPVGQVALLLGPRRHCVDELLLLLEHGPHGRHPERGQLDRALAPVAMGSANGAAGELVRLSASERAAPVSCALLHPPEGVGPAERLVRQVPSQGRPWTDLLCVIAVRLRRGLLGMPSATLVAMDPSRTPWEDVAELLRTQRQMARLSLRHLAKMTHVSDSYLSQVDGVCTSRRRRC